MGTHTQRAKLNTQHHHHYPSTLTEHTKKLAKTIKNAKSQRR